MPVLLSVSSDSIIAHYTGLRRGEILALEWSDIDFQEGLLHVRNKPFHRIKNHEERTILMSDEVNEGLLKLHSTKFRDSLVFKTIMNDLILGGMLKYS